MPYSLNSEKTEKLSQKYFKIDWNLYFNVEFGVRKSESPECRNSHRIRIATSIHKLHCKKFFQTGKKNVKRRNL